MGTVLSNLLFIALSFMFSIAMTWLIIPKIIIVSKEKKLYDNPNERSVHTEAVPRLGGVSFFPTIICSFCLAFTLRIMLGFDVSVINSVHLLPELLLLLSGITMLYLIGIADDLVGVGFKIKFTVQICSAILMLFSGIWINNLYGLFGLYEIPAWFGMPLTVLLVVFMTNAINLIDGIDGLASGLSSVALTILGFAYIEKELWAYAMLAFVTLGVLIPFFRFNVFGRTEKSQKIFMGDTGSLTLGFILSFLAIKYSHYDPAITSYTNGAIIIAYSALLIPAFDVIRVSLVRIKNKKNPFEADKTHIHHKFLTMGYSHRRVLCSILLIALIWSLFNICLIGVINATMILLLDVLLWFVICSLWIIRERKFK